MNFEEAIAYFQAQGLEARTLVDGILAKLPVPPPSDDPSRHWRFTDCGEAYIYREGERWIANSLAGQMPTLIKIADEFDGVVKAVGDFFRFQRHCPDHSMKVHYLIYDLQAAGLAATIFSDTEIKLYCTHKLPTSNVYDFMLNMVDFQPGQCEFLLRWEADSGRWVLVSLNANHPPNTREFTDSADAVAFLKDLHRKLINPE